MIKRLWTTIQNGTTQRRRDQRVDACIECGEPSLPASARCVDCVEN